MKRIILNADDFGMTPLFNDAILDLASQGSLSSISVMMSRISVSQHQHVERLIDILNTNNVSLGLHVEFFDTRYQYHIDRQLEGFQRVFGFVPDHFDLHAKTYLEDGYKYIIDTAVKYSKPCRNHDIPTGELGVICADYNLSVTRLAMDSIGDVMNDIQIGITEIILHPGYEDPWYITSLRKERQDDIEKAKMISTYILENDGYELISYKDLSL